MRFLLLLCFLSTPALADVDAVLDEVILPDLTAFSEAAHRLQDAADEDCRPRSLTDPYQKAYDAWMPLADFRIGPSETAALSLAFWPDPRGFTERTLTRLVSAEDEIAGDPAAYANVSIAARGLLALERLIYDPRFSDFQVPGYTCTLVRAVAADIANQADALDAAWRDEFAGTLRTAGTSDNATYLSEEEAVRAIYTQIVSGLEFTSEQRIGRPLGTFERPRPERAEAWRSDRPLRNVLLSVDSARSLAHALTDQDLPQIDAAVERVRNRADAIADPSFQNIETPQARLELEILGQAVRSLNQAIQAEIGVPLGISPGFNSQDGD